MSTEDRYQIGSAPDWRGNLVAPGDTVLYPRMSGRSVEMREASVLEVWRKVADRRRYRWDEVLRRHEYDYAAQYVYKLQPTGPGSREFYAGEQPVWIQNGENVTAV